MSPTSYYAIVQYDGSRFLGWQRQATGRTVQGALEQALTGFEPERIPIHAAGRTDTGVHALAQVISFELLARRTPGDLERALNAHTPEDLWVSHVGIAPSGFHARKHATSRRYRYVIGCDAASRSPFRRRFEWPLQRHLSFDALCAAAELFIGEHDFRGYSAVGQEKPHSRCVVSGAMWEKRSDGDGFIFTIEANRFLHRMVRFVVGAMVEVARDRRPPEDLRALLAATDNRDASPPAPPQGLFFERAHYPQLELGKP